MQLITTTDLVNARAVSVTATNQDLADSLPGMISDPEHHIAWSADVDHLMPFEKRGLHIVKPGDAFHTASLPSALGGYTAALVKTDATGDAADRQGIINEIANITAKVGDLEIIVTSSQLYEKLFTEKPKKKLEVTEDFEKLASQVLKLTQSLFSEKAQAAIKIICAFANTGENASEAWRKAKEDNKI